MGKRRHSYSRRRRKTPHRKSIMLAMLVLLLVCAAAIPALAWLTARSEVKNQFEIGEGDVQIVENIKETDTKKDVCVKNAGNVPVYVRASVAIYWEDADGSVMAETPMADTDYTITWGADDKWVKGTDGFYYYTEPVEEGQMTPNLIESVKDLKTHDDGRIFYVDIAVQSIQATPADAVKEAWGEENGGAVETATIGGSLKVSTNSAEDTDNTDNTRNAGGGA